MDKERYTGTFPLRPFMGSGGTPDPKFPSRINTKNWLNLKGGIDIELGSESGDATEAGDFKMVRLTIKSFLNPDHQNFKTKRRQNPVAVSGGRFLKDQGWKMNSMKRDSWRDVGFFFIGFGNSLK